MTQPLAERMRPHNIEQYIGQQHIIGTGTPLRTMIDQKRIPSFILWGPPGVGKTTLATIIASHIGTRLFTLNAVTSGVKDVRDIIEKAKSGNFFSTVTPILFIDEIHRFSKSQQDSLLTAVEKGIVTLIGATTENPSFEIIRPLLSRCQLYILEPLKKEELELLLTRTLSTDTELKNKNVELKETEALIRYSGGDARRLLNLLEVVIQAKNSDTNIIINNSTVEKIVEHSPASYDKGGEMHYDIISAFIKSIRGSDPQAAIYWLACMIEGGEDPKFIARRLIISASEDIGLANPNALLIANATAEAVANIGMPEGRIPLAEATIYLATSPKSNSAYNAINEAISLVKSEGVLPVPLHLRNAPTSLMKSLGYSDGYKYPHDYPNHYVEQQYLPDTIINKKFWKP